MTDLHNRLSKIETLERELTSKAAQVVTSNSSIELVDLFALGAAKRTLAQSRGFRSLIEAKNFPSAAILLRAQIDTAMRINGLKYLDNPESQLRKVLNGQRKFTQLVSWQKTEKNKPIYMKDVFLRNRLQEDAPWIERIYEEASDFAHLSFRHLFSSIINTDESQRTVMISISAEDETEDGESPYYEICDAFFSVSELACSNILGLLIARHNPAHQDAKRPNKS